MISGNQYLQDPAHQYVFYFSFLFQHLNYMFSSAVEIICYWTIFKTNGDILKGRLCGHEIMIIIK